MTQLRSMALIQRMQSPTPKFFKTLRTVGLALAAAGGALLTAPISFPAIIITIAGYATVAGSVITAVSQSAVKDESE